MHYLLNNICIKKTISKNNIISVFKKIHYVSVWIHVQVPTFLRFTFFFYFLFFKRVLTEFQWVLCTVYGTHKSLFPTKLSLKIGLTVLFTHLKIILLHCFQFSVFSFNNNKFNPNGPIISKI